MGILIRNTETGEEVTLDINVAEEVAAQMKESVLNTAAIATLGKAFLPPETVAFAVATLVGQVALLCIIKPSVRRDFDEMANQVLAETGAVFLKPGDVQGPVQKPSQVQKPQSESQAETISADEFLRMWDPPQTEVN